MLVIGLMVGALLATSATAFAGPVLKKVSAVLRPDYTIKVDGNKTELKNDPISYNGTTYVPLRELGEMFGRDVGFDSSTSTVTLDQKTEDVGDVSMPAETATGEWITLKQISNNYGYFVMQSPDNNKVFSVKSGDREVVSIDTSTLIGTTSTGKSIKVQVKDGLVLLNSIDLKDAEVIQ